MPITPLHLGPGSLLKLAMGRYLSLSVFALSQVLMDVEVVVRIMLGSETIHGFTNTIAGATTILVPGIVLGKPLCEAALRWWNRNLGPGMIAHLTVPPTISWTAAGVGAAAGVYSHWFLDALMHADAAALWPFETGNRFVSWMTIDLLNQLCIVTLAVGSAILMALRLSKRT